MGTNAVLDAARRAVRRAAARRSWPRPTTPRPRYGEAAYQTRTWPAPRRTIIKAEVVWHHGREPRDNPRFVITNLRQTPEWIYTHVYCARGDSENRFKELKLALAFGRTSCTRFWANQLRITLTAAAFVLFQELQLRARPDRAPRRASPAAPAGPDHDRRAGRALRPPDRPAFPALPSGRRHLDASRARARRRARVSPAPATVASTRRRCRRRRIAPIHRHPADSADHAAQTVLPSAADLNPSSPPLGGACRGRNSLTHE